MACLVRTGVSLFVASEGLMACCANRLKQRERLTAAERQRRWRVIIGGSLTRFFQKAKIHSGCLREYVHFPRSTSAWRLVHLDLMVFMRLRRYTRRWPH